MHLDVTLRVPHDWSQWIEMLDGNIFHSLEWAEMCSASNSKPIFFTWKNEAFEILAIAVGKQKWSRVPIAGRIFKMLEFESYPAMNSRSRSVDIEIIRQLVDFAKKKGFEGLEIRSFMASRAVPEMADMGLKVHERIEFVVDLSQPDDVLLKGFSSHHRRKLKKSRKYDLQVEEASTMEAMQDFRRLQVLSRDRRRDRGETIGVLSDDYYEKIGKQYFQHDLGRVFLAIHGQEPVSAAFISIYGGKALYAYGGSSDKGFKMDAPALLFWSIFSRCREMGCREFNLGGVPAASVEGDHPSHGLYRFKAGFGGRQVKCLSGTAAELRPGISKLRRLLRPFLAR